VFNLLNPRATPSRPKSTADALQTPVTLTPIVRPQRRAAAVSARGAVVPAVQRALSLLDRLAQQREPMSLARLAADLSLPKSSVHGLCSTLLSHGYLRRQDDGAFRLGPRVMSLAEAFVASTGVAQEFNALWPDAAAAPEETVLLSVLNGREVVYIAARQGTRPLGLAFKVGMRLPAWLAATGKVQLAFQSPDTVRGLLGPGPLAPMAGTRPVRMSELMKELTKTRQRGHSIDDEGVRTGVYCIGAPVFDAAGQPVAGLGICVHKVQPEADGLARYRDAVMLAAQALTQRLGGAAPFTEAFAANPASAA
jgi:DNA-binding IclR family transcriptional regulator